MGVGIMLEMAKTFVILGNRVFEKKQNITLNIRIGVFINCQTAGRVLRKKHADSFAGRGNKL